MQPVLALARDREALDHVAELGGHLVVEGPDRGDALGRDRIRVDPHPEAHQREQGELLRRVAAGHVEGGIGLGEPGRLRLGQRLVVGHPRARHRVQDIVRGAVDDPHQALDTVRCQTLAKGPQDRDPAADRAFEEDRDADLGGLVEQLAAVLGQQRLVGGHHVLAPSHRLEHPRLGGLDATDELDDHAGLGVGDDVFGIGGQQRRVDRNVPCTARAAHEHALDRHARTEAALDGVAVFLEDPHDASAHVPGAQKPDRDRSHGRGR